MKCLFDPHLLPWSSFFHPQHASAHSPLPATCHLPQTTPTSLVYASEPPASMLGDSPHHKTDDFLLLSSCESNSISSKSSAYCCCAAYGCRRPYIQWHEELRIGQPEDARLVSLVQQRAAPSGCPTGQRRVEQRPAGLWRVVGRGDQVDVLVGGRAGEEDEAKRDISLCPKEMEWLVYCKSLANGISLEWNHSFNGILRNDDIFVVFSGNDNLSLPWNQFALYQNASNKFYKHLNTTWYGQ